MSEEELNERIEEVLDGEEPIYFSLEELLKKDTFEAKLIIASKGMVHDFELDE